jgi:hypothetical protein
MRQFNPFVEKPKHRRAGATSPAASSAPRANVAPPVYRPSNNPTSVQRKPAVGAPPVYNPFAKASILSKNQDRIVCPKQGLMALCIRSAGTPAVSRHPPGELPVQRHAGAIPLPASFPANRSPTGRAQAAVAFAPRVYRPLANSGTAQAKNRNPDAPANAAEQAARKGNRTGFNAPVAAGNQNSRRHATPAREGGSEAR